MFRTISLLASFNLLVGCASVSTHCPPLYEYTPAQQKQAADELRTLLPPNSMTGQLVIDYKRLRDACRESFDANR